MGAIFGLLGMISAGSVILGLACLYYGVGPIQALALLNADVQVLMVVLPWLAVAFSIARWLRYLALKSNNKATAKDVYPFTNVMLLVGFGVFVVYAIKLVRYTIGPA